MFLFSKISSIKFSYLKWLQKQADARKLTELPDEFKDLTDDEKNLDYLKEKAGYFLVFKIQKCSKTFSKIFYLKKVIITSRRIFKWQSVFTIMQLEYFLNVPRKNNSIYLKHLITNQFIV